MKSIISHPRFSCFFCFSLLCCALSGQAQQAFYYAGDGKPIFLFEDRSSLSLHFSQAFDIRQSVRITHPDFLGFRADHRKVRDHLVIEFEQDQTATVAEVVANLGLIPSDVKSACWGLTNEYGAPQWLSHQLAYRPLEGTFDEAQFRDLLSSYPGTRRSETPTGLPLVIVPNIAQVVPLANALYESGMVHWAQPDFMVMAHANAIFPDDEYFDNLYYLHNTGQSVNFNKGVADIDIDAPEAWEITLGGSDIVVAVVDEGVEAHEDLEVDSTSTSRVLPGYSTSDPDAGVGAPIDSTDAHGQAVAGIIAASHNTIGVSGIAPNTRIFPVQVFTNDLSNISQFATAVDTAWRSGADIINNSWTFDFCSSTGAHQAIEDALDSALVKGRNGKGCVVFFSAGQDTSASATGDTCVSFPANHPGVVAMGAIDPKGNKPSYTNYGVDLDLVAPTSSASVANVTVIDRMGDLGYNTHFNYLDNSDFSNFNYTKWFGGTSVAAPQGSGVAALILTLDPTLTQGEVVSFMINAADDMGAAGFDNEFGNGRLNAHQALVDVQTNGGSFPVELIDFQAQSQSRSIQLNWQTASEQNNAYFVVEKKWQNQYQAIGQVAGVGTTQLPQSYQLTDESPLTGINVYRLRQVDLDGRHRVVAQVEAFFEGEAHQLWVRILPNPVQGPIQFQVLEQAGNRIRYEVLDLRGQLLLSGQKSLEHATAQITMPSTPLAAGHYLLRVISAKGQRNTLKFTLLK